MEDIFKVISVGSVEQLNKLICLGADINIQDKDKRTPLIHAVIDNQIEMVRLLIYNGAKINIQDSLGYTALHYAAQNYLVDICKILSENNAIVDIQDNYGNTPLFRAVFNSNERGDIIKLLLMYNADMNLKNKSGVSPLQLSKTIGNFNITQYME